MSTCAVQKPLAAHMVRSASLQLVHGNLATLHTPTAQSASILEQLSAP